ncbi:MAG: hypothetical protein A2X13_15320 [Bacteroidetes bacterium GWC2_33_15]|nr:MAG: hypothetical protein A2X10_13620 [Bacteroidetes bacterium GWA2_33_15]OFX49206.1 MAG: hypothetical protein A2X13_15320 [Bacteroidetes bacterium GWC2_33_15]OFX64675.1 MAG: hypothetical protein A2X15_03680 [Bacteroidetes bacterium GWB2_32_14]OFX69117.1 MAG: hypothetical protein A2X14_10235 [Bacteroidetes bacterium GWD2_33_33]HAN17624.1 hypothetical protein [Bacteroidales bacterium]
MIKKQLFILVMALVMPFFFSCEEEVDSPKAGFVAVQSSSTSEIIFTFEDKSTNSPDEWFWTFEGGYPSTSTEQNPTVSYFTSGTFSVTLAVKNDGGTGDLVRDDYICVGEFNNPTFTDIDITVNYVSKTIPVDGYVLFANIDNTSMSYYAETYGETAGGAQIGLLIYWDYTVNLNEYSAWNLIVNSDYVFFNIANNSSYEFYPFYVNYGTSDQTIDYITITNDGYYKSTGYYDAFESMEVRADLYSSPGYYAYWLENTHFNLPWESNQGFNLYYNGKNSDALAGEAKVKSIKNTNAGISPQTGAK